MVIALDLDGTFGELPLTGRVSHGFRLTGTMMARNAQFDDAVKKTERRNGKISFDAKRSDVFLFAAALLEVSELVEELAGVS